MNTIREQVELFHLLLIEQLARGLDNKLYAIKGGYNLRFFFNSMRYSEDLDIDVKTIAVDTLKNKINRILDSTPFQQILQTRGIEILEISLPKQTKTTQRWKMTIKKDSALPINTKIEFSRWGMTQNYCYEPINSSLIQHHNLRPILCGHYKKEAAFIQKIEALAGRPQTQARDIFDMFFLLNTGLLESAFPKIKNSIIEKAKENAFGISFKDFKSHVVAFLEQKDQAQYDSPELWDQIVLSVTEKIEAISS